MGCWLAAGAVAGMYLGRAILSESAKYPQKYCMGLVQGNVWGVSMDQKFLKDTPQFYSFSSVVHAEFCWICGLFPQ